MRYSLLLIVLAACGCSSSPSPLLPPVALKPIQNEFRVERLWSHKLDEGASDRYLHLEPVIRAGVLYSADYQGLVKATDLANHNSRWQADTGYAVGSGLAFSNNRLLFGTNSGKVIALDSANGEQRWSTQLSSEILATPQAAGGVVVVRCVNGQLFGLEEQTGKVLWSHEQSTPSLTLRGTSTPVISGDLVLNAFDNGRLVAVNLQTGKLIWQSSIAVPRGRTDLERMVDGDADPIVADNVVYAVAYQGRLAAMQLGSGRIIWTRDLDSYAGMTLDPYRLYVTDSEGVLWALDRTTGATLWKQDSLLRRSTTKPVLHKQYLVVGDFNGFIHWFRRDNGKLVARVRLNDASYYDPDLNESQDIKFPKSSDILLPPLFFDDKLLAVDRHGHTEAFQMSYP